jgi:4-carboxymuconolactone decarboxylase
MTTDRHDSGLRTRRAVPGEPHADRAGPAPSGFGAPFERPLTGAARGRAWADGSICARQRPMPTPAPRAPRRDFDGIAMHIRATRDTGASPEGVMRALRPVAAHAGVPRANHAIRPARGTCAGMLQEAGG